MKDSLPLLLERRFLRKGRKKDCLNSFWEKIWRGVLLVDYAEKSKSVKIKSEARRQFIVTLVTAFEVYVGDLVVELIDSKKITPVKLSEILTRKYTYEDVLNILENKITRGELIWNQLNFQNIDAVGKIFSSVFDIDFFEFIKSNKFEYQNIANETVVFEFNDRIYSKLEKIFNFRHRFVHNYTFRDTPRYEYLNSSRKLIINFAFSVEILADKFRHNRKCKIIKKRNV